MKAEIQETVIMWNLIISTMIIRTTKSNDKTLLPSNGKLQRGQKYSTYFYQKEHR
jgi:hypothetical protein